jgi:predicted HTH transcriptional regulator
MRLEQPADEGAERGAHFVSRFTKNRNAPSELLPLDWTIELEINGTVRVGTVETSTADLIVQWVRDGLSTPSDIAAETGLSKGTISRHATRLIKTGRLKKTGREYELGRGEKQP